LVRGGLRAALLHCCIVRAARPIYMLEHCST